MMEKNSMGYGFGGVERTARKDYPEYEIKKGDRYIDKGFGQKQKIYNHK